MRNRASTWRRCKAFSEPSNSTPITNNIILTSGWSICRILPSGQPGKSIEWARRSFPALRANFSGSHSVTTALEIDPESPAVFQAWKTVLSFLATKDWEALLPRLNRMAAAHPQNAELAFAYGAALFRLEVSKGQEGAFDRPQSFL